VASSLLTVLLAVVLAGLGFAHRPGGPVSDPRLAAYVSAGGSVSDLCEAHGRDGPSGARPCEACRLVGAALLPEAPPLAAPGAPLPALRLARDGEGLRTAFLRDPSRGVRGPPVPGFS
jgi:hypothetical protein